MADDLLEALVGNEQLDVRRQFLLDNPDAFLLTYFPHALGELKEFHLRLIDSAVNYNRALILYPAAHGKTTLIGTMLPIWAICRNPNIRITYIARTDDDARSVMNAIQSELENNDRLIADFGPFRQKGDRNKPWSTERFSVAKRTLIHPRSTFEVYGQGANILGHRTDWVICDDVVTEKNSATIDQRVKTKEWFDLGVATMPEEEDDRITVVGTLFHPQDLYHDLRERLDPETGDPIWKIQREDAILSAEEKTVLWPERWSYRRLMNERASIGTLSFNKRYRNIARDESQVVFREEHIRGGYLNGEQYPGCLDTSYRLGEYDPSWIRVAGFDPAVGTTRHAKFCAHMTIGLGTCAEHKRCLWVIDIHRDQMTLPRQVTEIISKHQEYQLLASVIEANSYQAGLHQSVMAKTDELGLALNMEPHFTGSNKEDPEIGVARMGAWFERGWVHIPWADQVSRSRMGKFVDELEEWPGTTTDTVMAFWFAWLKLQTSFKTLGSFNRLETRKKNTFRSGKKPIGRRVLVNPYYEDIIAQREQQATGQGPFVDSGRA